MASQDVNTRIQARRPELTPDHDKLPCFAYVTAEKAGLYRAVMRLFVEAKARFKLHLRPDEVAAAVDGPPWRADRVEVDRALQQLCDWGNLEKHLDTMAATSVEQFLHPEFLYQITDTGQAVERALRTFEEAMNQTGQLQTTALHDIRDELAALLQLTEREAIDEAEAFRSLDSLRSRFDGLTGRAQTFLSSLQRTTQLQGIDLREFMDYKQRLIDHLKKFIGELTIAAGEIAKTIGWIDESGADRLLQAAASRELRDAVVPPTDAQHEDAVERWQLRWAGLRGWFIAEAQGERSQAQELRSHARSAIPALLRAVVMLHDRRVMRSDCVADSPPHPPAHRLDRPSRRPRPPHFPAFRRLQSLHNI